MEYIDALEDLLEAIVEAERYNMWPDGVKAALQQAMAMKHVWYNREG